MQVLLDRLEGASATRGADGTFDEIIRPALVIEISPQIIASYSQAPNVLIDACLAAGMPAPGVPHPKRPEVVVVSHRARPKSDTSALVEIIYRKPSTLSSAGSSSGGQLAPPHVDINCSLMQLQTQRTYAGSNITLRYKGLVKDSADRLVWKDIEKVGTVSAYEPATTYRISKWVPIAETVRQGIAPGSINSAEWRGISPRHLLYAGFATSYATTDAWKLVVYTLIERIHTWDAFSVVKILGEIPIDVKEWAEDDFKNNVIMEQRNGITRVTVQAPVAFNVFDWAPPF